MTMNIIGHSLEVRSLYNSIPYINYYSLLIINTMINYVIVIKRINKIIGTSKQSR